MTLMAEMLFETPVIHAAIADAEAIGRELRRVASERRQQSPSDTGQSWRSDGRMLRWGGESARELLGQCVPLADQFTIDTGAPPERTRYGWWASLRSEFAGPETRIGTACDPSAFWSAVMLAGDGDSGSVDVVFEDPRYPMIQMEDPGLRVRLSPDGPTIDSERRFELSSGQLLMFPAWLRRRVEFGATPTEWPVLTLNLTAFLATARAGEADEQE